MPRTHDHPRRYSKAAPIVHATDTTPSTIANVIVAMRRRARVARNFHTTIHAPTNTSRSNGTGAWLMTAGSTANVGVGGEPRTHSGIAANSAATTRKP